MDRTLYLTENRGLVVTRDGPSLWVTQEGKAGTRVPARLIGRVVVIGNVRMDAGVITLFAARGIPVTFMNRRGEASAVSLPCADRFPRHHDKQRAFLSSEAAVGRYRTFLSAHRQMTQLDCLKRIAGNVVESWEREGFREKDYRKILGRFAPAGDETWTAARDVVANLFRELVIGVILKAGLDPHLGIVHRRDHFGFALDLCHALDAEIDTQTQQFLRADGTQARMSRERGGWIVTKTGLRDIIHRFENRAKAVRERTETVVDGFFELARELRL